MTRIGSMAAALAALGGVATAAEITLAAGAGYRRPIAELAAAFEATGGDKVLQVFGNMGQVLAQARESGRIALVCGDRVVLDKAEGVRFVDYAPLGPGRLVVAWRKGLSLGAPEEIAGEAFARIGIPDQKSAIYGRAGREFLDRAGLAAAVQAKLVPVATVPQVTSYLVSGEVDAGFVNATDAIGAADGIGGHLAVDPALYDPIEIACGVIDAQAAAPFAAFLASDVAHAILARHGL